MDKVILVAPVLPEKTEAWRRFCQEIIGRRREHYERSRRQLNIVREAAWLAPAPHGAMAVITIVASDPAESWRQLGCSQRPFDRWFRRKVLEIHGLDLSRPLTQIPSELAFQWELP